MKRGTLSGFMWVRTEDGDRSQPIWIASNVVVLSINNSSTQSDTVLQLFRISWLEKISSIHSVIMINKHILVSAAATPEKKTTSLRTPALNETGRNLPESFEFFRQNQEKFEKVKKKFFRGRGYLYEISTCLHNYTFTENIIHIIHSVRRKTLVNTTFQLPSSHLQVWNESEKKDVELKWWERSGHGIHV